MLSLWVLFNFCCFSTVLSSLSPPVLEVRNVDKNAINLQRMDTMEACRKFNLEINDLNKAFLEPIHLRPMHEYYAKSRPKRAIETVKFGNPALNSEDVRRVENIVETFYDDETGKGAIYRQKAIPNPPIKPKPINVNESGRRFDFAPHLLEAQDEHTNHPFDKDQIIQQIPWSKKWKLGIVPYYIDSHTYDFHLANVIVQAFDHFEQKTCIKLQRLRQRPTDKRSLSEVEWVYITNPNGLRQCVHSNERKENKGVQIVVFGYDCMSQGEIVHEVMHVLGFSHEHTRPDRDQHVTIMWDNIKPGYKKYFQIRGFDPLMTLKYDHSSVLHYPPRAFSKNGQVTIKSSALKGNKKIGQREGLSDTDTEKVIMIFGPECREREKQYLLSTCPSVVKAKPAGKNVTQKSINNYFKDRLWHLGTVKYKLKDLAFSTEEIENIEAVIRHIEQVTCIKFENISSVGGESNVEDSSDIEKRDVTEKKDESDNKSDELIILQNLSKETNTSCQDDSDDNNPPVMTDNELREGKNVPILRKKESKNTVQQKLSSTNVNVSTPVSVVIPQQSRVLEGKAKLGQTTVSGTKKTRRKRALLLKKARRHDENGANLVIFTRSAKPGCKCPKPGRPNGKKLVKINADCFNTVNDLLHLFVHVLGLEHQHNMHDRDEYLHIMWDNLAPEVKEEMKTKLPPEASVGIQYDYQSVMHYPWLEIKNGVTNYMYPVWNDGWAMGHWQGLSSTDIRKLDILYAAQCKERKKLEGSQEKSKEADLKQEESEDKLAESHQKSAEKQKKLSENREKSAENQEMSTDSLEKRAEHIEKETQSQEKV